MTRVLMTYLAIGFALTVMHVGLVVVRGRSGHVGSRAALQKVRNLGLTAKALLSMLSILGWPFFVIQVLTKKGQK
jgi:hypothetical protein